MASTIYTLEELVDLALQTPEIGSVNFNILKLVLHKILFECKIQNVTTEWIPALTPGSEDLDSIIIPPDLLSTKPERKDERGKDETEYEKLDPEEIREKVKFTTRDLKTEPTSKDAKEKFEARVKKSESESRSTKFQIEPAHVKQKTKPENAKSKVLTEHVKGKTDPKHAKDKTDAEHAKDKTDAEHAKHKTDPEHAKDKTELEYIEGKIEPKVSGAITQPRDTEEKSEPKDSDVTLKQAYPEMKQKDPSKMKAELKVSIEKVEDEGEKEKEGEAHKKEDEDVPLQKFAKKPISEERAFGYTRKPTDSKETSESKTAKDETRVARDMFQRWELKKIMKRVEAVEEGLNNISLSVEELVDWKKTKTKRLSIPEEYAIGYSGPTIGREEFEDVVEEIGETLSILQSRLTKQKEECEATKHDFLKEINLRPTGEEMNQNKEELIEKLNILGKAISSMQKLIKNIIYPEACGTTKCLTCRRIAHIPDSGIVLDRKKAFKAAFVESEKKITEKKKLKPQVDLPFTTTRLKRIAEEGKMKKGETVADIIKEDQEDQNYDEPISLKNFINIEAFDISDLAKEFTPLRPFPDVMRRNYIHLPSKVQVDRPNKAPVRISVHTAEANVLIEN